MRFFNIFATVLPMFFAVFVSAQEPKISGFYGEAFQIRPNERPANAIFDGLDLKDAVKAQLTGKIKEVCQAKGCWMKVALDGGSEVFVKFKDYGFFVPTNAADMNVVMNGIAFQEEISVEEQRHYAKDRGDSPEEINKINSPKKTLRFEADGVLIQAKD
ncbi:DUF4920 domain-containing protein [Flagellimonas meishanensis]|uniref:DUF4920 domain-containing protein n=1 Tax=Flagellimonas meishanensis TaxID=2873264 RepID=UPI001CA694BB|nr:DUF4920 domain-containing protein [[Muricauda] meishanensis]